MTTIDIRLEQKALFYLIDFFCMMIRHNHVAFRDQEISFYLRHETNSRKSRYHAYTLMIVQAKCWDYTKTPKRAINVVITFFTEIKSQRKDHWDKKEH